MPAIAVAAGGVDVQSGAGGAGSPPALPKVVSPPIGGPSTAPAAGSQGGSGDASAADQDGGGTQAGKRHHVSITKKRKFDPKGLTIVVGDQVVWKNDAKAWHSVDFDDTASGKIRPGETYSRTFGKAGTYNYFDQHYSEMEGTIKVVAAADTSATGATGATGSSGGTAGGSSFVPAGGGTPVSSTSPTSSSGSSGGSGGSLPATGADLILLALIGGNLLAGGLVLREALAVRRAR